MKWNAIPTLFCRCPKREALQLLNRTGNTEHEHAYSYHVTDVFGKENAVSQTKRRGRPRKSDGIQHLESCPFSSPYTRRHHGAQAKENAVSLPSENIPQVDIPDGTSSSSAPSPSLTTVLPFSPPAVDEVWNVGGNVYRVSSPPAAGFPQVQAEENVVPLSSPFHFGVENIPQVDIPDGTSSSSAPSPSLTTGLPFSAPAVDEVRNVVENAYPLSSPPAAGFLQVQGEENVVPLSSPFHFGVENISQVDNPDGTSSSSAPSPSQTTMMPFSPPAPLLSPHVLNDEIPDGTSSSSWAPPQSLSTVLPVSSPPVDCEKNLKEENERLRLELEFIRRKLDRTSILLNKTQHALMTARRQRDVFKTQVDRVNTKMKNFQTNLSERFGEDQLDALSRGGSLRGTQWTDRTVLTSMRIHFSCGTTGYEVVSDLQMPLPSLRVVRERLKHIKFRPGLLTEVFAFLAGKTAHMTNFEVEAMLGIDEMSLKPAEEADPSTNSYIGKCTLPRSKPKYMKKEQALLFNNDPKLMEEEQQKLSNSALDTLATKAMVFILGGIKSRWKQTIAYHFTSSSYCAETLKKFIIEILQKCHD